MIRNIKKSNGHIVPFNPEQLNRWAEWAGNIGVNWSDIVFDAVKRCYDGCSTSDLQWAMINSCLDKQTPEHIKMAGRILAGTIYKEAFGGFKKIPTLKNFYHDMNSKGLWSKMDYTDQELDLISEFVNHSKDLEYGYAVLKQFKDKYAIRNIHTGKTFESPQFMFMGMAMMVMQKQPKHRRLDDIKKLYTFLSDLKINAPTPYLNGLRSRLSGYASCCVIKGGDTAQSIGVANWVAYEMTCKQAGIGIMLDTRSAGDGVRNNTIKHQGKVPYYRVTDASVKANKQQSRGGSATVGFLAVDPEIETLLRLNHPTTPAKRQIKHMDYQVGINKSLIERAMKNQEWVLASFSEAPELHKAMYKSYEEFEVVLNKVLTDGSIKKTVVSARDVVRSYANSRLATGRIYPFFADNMNRHTPFIDTVYNSNLCMEIQLPTKPFYSMEDLYQTEKMSEGEIALCFLSSIVAGRVSKEEYEEVAYYTLLMIDSVMDLMEYPFESMRKSAQYRRSVGVGITNLAHYLASNFTDYSSEHGKRLMHELAELHSYSLHKASLQLAKERGVCEGMKVSKYRAGWTPVKTYNRNVDKIVDGSLNFDWDKLSEDIRQNGGIRHSVLEAFMPNESSSLATNTTNGLYPIREPVMYKKSPQGATIFIAPDYDILGSIYQSAWDVPQKDMIECYAIFQKFTGQAISSDFYMDYSKNNRKVSFTEFIKELHYAHSLGLKTQYYLNSKVGVGKTALNEIECEGCSL